MWLTATFRTCLYYNIIFLNLPLFLSIRTEIEYKLSGTINNEVVQFQTFEKKQAHLKMKQNCIVRNSQNAVCFIFLTLLMVLVRCEKCPMNIPSECNCEMIDNNYDKTFNYICSMNSETISTKIAVDRTDILTFFHFNCENVTAGDILKLLNFDSFDFADGVQMTINVCPMSVISMLSSLIAHKNNVSYFRITVNDISTLPADILKSHPNLHQLVVRGNQLKTLPEHLFVGQTSLLILRLSQNQLTTLPENIFKSVTNLFELQLSGNKLQSLPPNIFDSLTYLFTLHLERNLLQTLPERIFKRGKYLKFLFLNQNGLVTLSENIFENLTSLLYLNLNVNKLHALPSHLFDNQFHLKFLYLSANGLETLPETIFSTLFDLRELHLHGNRLQTLPEKIFKNQNNLHVLYLNQNSLTVLPAQIFSGLSNLKLKTLRLKGNPWRCNGDFLKIVRQHESKLDYDDIMCGTEPVRDRLSNNSKCALQWAPKWKHPFIENGIHFPKDRKICYYFIVSHFK